MYFPQAYNLNIFQNVQNNKFYEIDQLKKL